MSSPAAYFNEHDPGAAAWLRELVKRGLIAPGEVDERDIQAVQPGDLAGFTQCHFFAGIGGWSYALRLAGWADDAPVWTGSCPCQPFSGAGQERGFADARHVWPFWFRLVSECRPPVVFGEQVARKTALPWLDAVSDDLETAGYAVAAADLPASSVGAPHIRQRFWFVADTQSAELQRLPQGGNGARILAEAGSGNVQTGRLCSARLCTVGDPDSEGLARPSRQSLYDGTEFSPAERAGSPTGGFWGDAEWLPCRDGKARPVEPGSFPLANGLPARVGRLRGYGNAISPQVAAEFIQAYLEARGLTHA